MTFPNPRLYTRPAERMRARCVFAERFISRESMAENGLYDIASETFLTVSRGLRNGGVGNLYSFKSHLSLSDTTGKGTVFIKFSGARSSLNYFGITARPGDIKVPIVFDRGTIYYGPTFASAGHYDYLDGNDHCAMCTFETSKGASFIMDDGTKKTTSASSGTETLNNIEFNTYIGLDVERIMVFNDVLDTDDFDVLRDDNWTDFFINDMHGLWRMDAFANDTVGYKTRSKDLLQNIVLSDGVTASSRPTFNSFGRDSFYHFDGVNDLVSNLPDMPAAFTTSLCVSDETGDGRFPETVFEDSETTILDGMGEAGAFSYDNIHSLYIADRELREFEKKHLSYLQTFDTNWGVISGALRNLINEGVVKVCLQFENPTVLNEIVSKGARSFSVSGATFSGATRTFSFPNTSDRLNLQNISSELDFREVTLIVFGTLTGAIGGAGLIHKGTGLQFSVNGDSLYFGGTSNASEAGLGDAADMYSVVCHTGYKPRFFKNERFIGEGSSTVAITDSNTSSWTFGNNAANSSNLSGCNVRSFIVLNTCLTDREIADVYHSLRGDHDYAGAAS